MLLLGGCLNTTDNRGPELNYGFVFLETTSDDGQIVTNPNAVFYRTNQLQLPSTNGTQDICVEVPFRDDQVGGTLPPALSAGATVQVAVSGETATLTPSTTTEGTRYVVSGGTALPFTPGDSATVTIPGAEDGFPSWTLKAKTAEAFTPQAVPHPTEAVALQLRWAPAASSTGSRMLVSLRYPSEAGDEMLQLYCELNDDGTHDVDPLLSRGWREAVDAETDVVWARWRITGQAKTGAALLVISTYQVPLDAPNDPL